MEFTQTQGNETPHKCLLAFTPLLLYRQQVQAQYYFANKL